MGEWTDITGELEEIEEIPEHLKPKPKIVRTKKTKAYDSLAEKITSELKEKGQNISFVLSDETYKSGKKMGEYRYTIKGVRLGLRSKKRGENRLTVKEFSIYGDDKTRTVYIEKL